jgi:hypothetical protein
MSAERIESQLTVPASTTCSVSNGAQTSAVTCTLTSGTYFPTTLASHLQTLFNANVNGYPRSAAALASVIGGTWTAGAGWLCDESATPLVPAFGSPNLTAGGTPTYLNAGPAGGVDYAVGFDAGAEYFDGGDVYDVTGTDDLIVAWVGYVASTPAGFNALITKMNPAIGAGWQVSIDPGGGFVLYGQDAALAVLFNFSNASLHVGEWHVGIATIDRATGKARIGTRGLTSGTTSVSSETTVAATSMTNAAAFRVGDRADNAGAAPQSTKISAVYVVSGGGVAAGLSANLSTVLASFASAINSSFTVAISATDGRTTISNSFWPSYVTFSSTLRSTLGFAYDFDYPQTAAQAAVAIGGTWTSGAGYLFDAASGNPASIFGTPSSLTASSITYSHLGARGGADLAIGFDNAADYADGGSVFDPGTGDLLVVGVAKWTAIPASGVTVVSKGVDGAFSTGWAVFGDQSYDYGLIARDSGSQSVYFTDSVGFCVGEPHVFIAVIDRSTGKMRFGTRGLLSGTTTTTSEVTSIGSVSGSPNFRIGSSAWLGAPTTFQLSALYIVTGSGVATGLSANLSTALTSFAAYMKSQTGTMQAECLWIPGCSLSLDSGDPSVAPIGDDARATVSPDGNVYGTSETTFYHHRGLRFSRVAKSKVWANHATYVNADYETWYLDTQLGHHAWCIPFARVKVYFDNAGVATEVGGGDVAGWKMPNPTKLNQLRNAVDPWTGLVDVKLGDLFASE